MKHTRQCCYHRAPPSERTGGHCVVHFWNTAESACLCEPPTNLVGGRGVARRVQEQNVNASKDARCGLDGRPAQDTRRTTPIAHAM
jgi:hypothetical protein